MSSDAALEITNIHKSHNNLEVIRGISLKAYEGDVISILGSSGSGKSTLLRCINLLEIPNAGEIYIAGEQLKLGNNNDSIDQKQLTRIRTKVGFVFQSFNLWPHKTLLENVIEAPIRVLKINKKEATEQAIKLLTRVGLVDRCNYYPYQLSGGQQQRGAIARTLAMNPKVILFDEPTSALDPEMVFEVLSVIKSLAEDGTTMLIVTHELNFARNVANKLIFLHEGKIEEEGESREMFDNPKTHRFANFINNHKFIM